MVRLPRWNVGLQSKITLYLIAIVVSVLSIAITASRLVIERQARLLLRSEYITLVRQIGAGIGTLEELRNRSVLEQELAKLREIDPEIVLMEIFDLTSGVPQMTARSGAGVRELSALPNESEIGMIRRGDPVARLAEVNGQLFWEIQGPVRIGTEASGLVLAQVSMRRFEALVARDRLYAALVTMAVAAVILVFLVWYLRRKIGQPMASLVGEMARVEAGDLERQVSIESPDEIGALAAQFNRMLFRVREGTEAVRLLNESLQDRVEQATTEVNRRYEDLARVNRRLSEMQLRLAHSERLAAAGQMAAALAHKIGTPLHSTLGHLQRLKRDTSEEKREERLKIIESQLERMVQSIQEVLETVRKPAPPMGPVEVNALLRGLLDLTMPVISLRGIEVETGFEERLPMTLGDAGELQEAFLNLLTNAMDAMPNGGVLRLETRSIDGAIRVTVADTGVGIAEADLPKIFEPFFTTKERGKGTGLGLSICRNIVRGHGGEIEVESRRGAGTTWVLTLPGRDDETR
ncbi:MAG: sensor histidine kinase [Candidatus Manganitrophaceae bacterium]|nr:MAG: sensor histidine kinase [Candidatus Manganitrophaceae bacterium]